MSDQEPMLRWFTYAHLSDGALRAISAEFGDLAQTVADALPPSAERTVCLRKLLEAKDCAVRAALDVIRAAGATPGPNLSGR